MYLNLDRLEAIDAATFRNARPYPWMSLKGALTEDGYERLYHTLPELELFEPVFGKPRQHGQQSHDRYALEWRDDLPVAREWHELVAELRGEAYQRFLARMIGHKRFDLHFHWHYTPRGCSVSPHCDAAWKIGSHIFYFNTKADWDTSWGGETLVLDDAGRFSRRSAPAFEDFEAAQVAESLGNRSLLFARRGNSWHGVRPIEAPEGYLRKVFIVVITLDTAWYRLRRRLHV